MAAGGAVGRWAERFLPQNCGQAAAVEPVGPAPPAPGPFGIAVPAKLQGPFILRPQGSAWHIWHVASRYVPDPRGQPASESGYLIVTDQRMIFLKKQGMVFKNYSTTMTISFEHVRGVSAKEGLTMKRSITVSVEQAGGIGNVVFQHLSQVDAASLKRAGRLAPSSAQRMLNALVQNRLCTMEEERRRGRIQYVLDFSFLKEEMERGGVVVQTIRCPRCGADVELPPAGSSTMCAYCGTPVLAQDVFEKMKDIIGAL